MTHYPKGGAQSTTLHSRGSMPPLKDFIAGIDLPALVATYAGPGKHSGGKYLHQCPNPEHYDGHPSFSVFVGRGGVWQCHCLSQCGHIGDALDFVAWQLRCDKSEAVRKLREWAGQPAPLGNFTPKSAKPKHVAAAKHDPGYTVQDNAQALNDYLASRQWPREVVEAFGLQVVRLNRHEERNTLRVLHPFFEHKQGEWRATSWQARRLDNLTDRKWQTPLGGSLPLYNLRALDAQEVNAAVVCEGPADTVTAWLALRDLPSIAVVGVPGAQSLRSLTTAAAYFTGLAVIIAADNDTAGEEMTGKVAAALKSSASLLAAVCPPNEVNDLTDMAKAYGLDAVRQLLTKALPLRVPPSAPTTTPPGDEWAATWAMVVAQFPTAAMVCKVCAAPTPHTYCANCTALTKHANGKPVKWCKCDQCGEHSLAGHGKKCPRCGGSRVNCEVQP